MDVSPSSAAAALIAPVHEVASAAAAAPAAPADLPAAVAAPPRVLVAPAARLAQLLEHWVTTTADWSVERLERALVAIVRRVARHAGDWDKSDLLDALERA